MVPRTVGAGRLAVGAIQGGVLYWLYQARGAELWPATAPFLFVPLLLLALVAPVLLISSLGHMTGRRAAGWLATASAVMLGLGLHDVWRRAAAVGAAAGDAASPAMPSPLLFLFLVAGFFIAHALVLSAIHDGRRLARYPTYFDVSWKLLIQLGFSAMFVGALWLALSLGAVLFMLVRLDFLETLLKQSWFAIPASVFAFACAMHITDVRPAIVRGIRSLLLVLLSWLLPLSALIVLAFLLSLVFTGLEPLWATRKATAVLLGAAALLVVLINAAYQNGEQAATVPRLVRWSALAAALTLLPIVAIAVYSLALRVADYGWTTDRVIAAACLAVAACYALGYGWAAYAFFRRGEWMQGLAPVNIATACVVLAVLLGLFSPLADPARLSVDSQVGRLLSGATPPDKFDFDYLHAHGARYGRAALEQLQAAGGADGQIRDRAGRALARKARPGQPPVPASQAEVAANITVWPRHAGLPTSFRQQNWSDKQQRWQLPPCLRQAGMPCDAVLLDIDRDGRPEVLLLPAESQSAPVLLGEGGGGGWSVLGRLPGELNSCASLRRQLLDGTYGLVPARVHDLEIGGQRMAISRQPGASAIACPP
jgi:hypothetical protein